MESAIKRDEGVLPSDCDCLVSLVQNRQRQQIVKNIRLLMCLFVVVLHNLRVILRFARICATFCIFLYHLNNLRVP